MINIFKNFNIFWHKNLVIHYPCSLPKSYDFDGFRQQKIVNTYHHRITNFSTILLTLFRRFSTLLLRLRNVFITYFFSFFYFISIKKKVYKTMIFNKIDIRTDIPLRSSVLCVSTLGPLSSARPRGGWASEAAHPSRGAGSQI